jgi:hypothetical protein
MCLNESHGVKLLTPAVNVAPQVHKTESWAIVTNPPLAWSQEADAAIARGDVGEAIDMIWFAYLSADAGEGAQSESDLYGKEALIGTKAYHPVRAGVQGQRD